MRGVGFHIVMLRVGSLHMHIARIRNAVISLSEPTLGCFFFGFIRTTFTAHVISFYAICLHTCLITAKGLTCLFFQVKPCRTGEFYSA